MLSGPIGLRLDSREIGGYASNLANTYHEPASRHKQVTVILRHESDTSQSHATNIDLAIGDGSDLETLHEAGAE